MDDEDNGRYMRLEALVLLLLVVFFVLDSGMFESGAERVASWVVEDLLNTLPERTWGFRISFVANAKFSKVLSACCFVLGISSSEFVVVAFEPAVSIVIDKSAIRFRTTIRMFWELLMF